MPFQKILNFAGWGLAFPAKHPELVVLMRFSLLAVSSFKVMWWVCRCWSSLTRVMCIPNEPEKWTCFAILSPCVRVTFLICQVKPSSGQVISQCCRFYSHRFVDYINIYQYPYFCWWTPPFFQRIFLIEKPSFASEILIFVCCLPPWHCDMTQAANFPAAAFNGASFQCAITQVLDWHQGVETCWDDHRVLW